MTSRFLPDVLRGDRGRPGLPGPAGGMRNMFPYVTFVDPNSTSTDPPDGSYANPFLTVDSAIAALDAAFWLAEYVIMLAPTHDDYDFCHVEPVANPDRNYRFVGLSHETTRCTNWIVTGTTGLLTFVHCTVATDSSGHWNQHGYSLKFEHCYVQFGIQAIGYSPHTMVLPPYGLVRFVDTVGPFGGATVSDNFTWVEIDGRSKWGLGLPPTTRAFAALTPGDQMHIRDACSIPRSNFEFWCDSNSPRDSQNNFSGNAILRDGSVAHPFSDLQECLDCIARLIAEGASIQSAAIHLAPVVDSFGVAVPYYASSAGLQTRLCFMGSGSVRDVVIGTLFVPSLPLEIRDCYVLSDSVICRTLDCHHCVVDSEIVVDTTIEYTTCKVEAVGGIARTYTSTAPGAPFLVDSYTDYSTSSPVPTLINLTKVIADNNP